MVSYAETNGWRSYSDYRALNSVVEPDSYMVPHIHVCIAALQMKRIVSQIDLPSYISSKG